MYLLVTDTMRSSNDRRSTSNWVIACFALFLLAAFNILCSTSKYTSKIYLLNITHFDLNVNINLAFIVWDIANKFCIALAG